jgi:predicted ATPase/DNA-binding SARP family transcriptional activator
VSNKLEVKLLGRFEVSFDGKPIAITSRPAQSLFAYLILSAGTAHRREKLAGMLWSDSLEETARDNLRHALWRIRKALETASSIRFLYADDLTIKFEVSSEYWLDAAELEKVNEDASADELMAALVAYHGELLPGFYDEWVVLEREHLSSVFEHHMARLMSLLQEEKRWLDILDWGERWIKLGQRPEPAYRALMSAHAAKGDMSKVAATYERCVKSLKEFGIEPSEQTKALYQKLKVGKGILETESSISLKEKGKESPKTNLPEPITSFIGREKEVQEITKFLGKNRLVTLTGSGGVGKTRLAIQSSNKLLDKFKDGVWWIDLVGLSDPALVSQAVAKVVDLHEVPNQPLIETLVEELQTKQVLLVLDNCEHLILACAQLADRLLSGTKFLKILATSREALDILGETVWLVPSLSLPDARDSVTVKKLSKSESIHLFMERATVMQPQFTLTDQNANAVVQICRRLSGMPLAIELAAARVKMMTVDEIASRLDDRFSLLTSGNRSALPRQQTLRATIDWSHDLLSEPERVLFRRLAVFAGGFRLDAAESICSHDELKRSDILDLLGRLVDKSLVVVDSAAGGQTRYRFLETIREYGFDKLKKAGEETLVRDHHLEFFMRVAVETEPHLYAPEQAEWFARTDAEIDNLRAALDWSITGTEENETRIRNGLQLVGVLSWFWQKGYSYEFSKRLKNMLSHTTADMQTIARARALIAEGFLHWSLGNFVEARPHLVEALELARNHEDKLTLGWALVHLGIVLSALEEYDLAQSLLEECVAITKGFRNAGMTVAGMALSFLGDIYLVRNNEVHAREVYEEGIKLLRETNNSNNLAYTIRRFGYLALKEADYERANVFFRESLIRNQELGHQIGITAAIAGLAELAQAVGKFSRAAQLYGIIEGRLAVLSLPLYITDQVEFNRGISALRARLDEKTCAKFWTKGKTMSLDEAIAFALGES